MKLHNLYFILLLLAYQPLLAQEKVKIDPAFSLEGDVSLIGKWDTNTIKLRWGFTHPQLWYHHINKPVTLFRRNVTKKGQYVKIAEIMPLDSTTMESLASTTGDEMLVVTLENIYRHWENTTFKDYGSVLERNDNFHNRWSLTHLAADRSFLAAKAAGLGYVDTPPSSDDTYAYKIVADGNVIISDYKVVFRKKEFIPVIFDVVEEEGNLVINWDKKLHDYHFTAFWIEYSTDSIQFSRANDAPYIQMIDQSVTDQRKFYSYRLSVTNYQKTFVRLVGIDPFGEESTASPIESGMGRDKTPPPPPVLVADTSKTHLTRLFHIQQENGADVASYTLERSIGNQTTVIKNWAKGGAASATDTLPFEGIYKYRLIALDAAGNEAPGSFIYTKIYDLIPPAKPSKPSAITDTSGVISLYWDKHPEQDVIGYNIYAADGNGRNFIKLNAHIHRQHIYLDTVKLSLMNEKRHYYITAVDNDYMISACSDTLIVNRPDIVPPSPAHIVNYLVTDTSIRLTIFPSSSRDVVRHELWRKEGDSGFTLHQSFTDIPKSFEDLSIKPSTAYTYSIIAIDDVGLQSKAVKEVHLTTLPGLLPIPDAELSATDGTIQLSLRNQLPPSGKIVVYKSIDNGPLLRLKESNRLPFEDKNTAYQNITYRLAFKDDLGHQGPLSAPITWTSKTK
ncbi:MAG: hypothetical protein KDC49_22475 [Saprospiraceae bacterium]|nr:hypothetical protein [Saprospiraceae bacterium]